MGANVFGLAEIAGAPHLHLNQPKDVCFLPLSFA